MDLSYEWIITGLKKAPSLDGLSDVITNVKFQYIGTDANSGESASFIGACPIGAPNSENFISFNNLKESDVIDWVEANHDTEHMEYVIEKEINEKITPKTQKALLPWNN